MSNKKRSSRPLNTDLTLSEFMNPAVIKLKIEESNRLKQENRLFKKSLKETQNLYEKLRDEKGRLETSHAILKERQGNAILPEIIKFIASNFGAGVAFLLWSASLKWQAVIAFLISLSVYAVVHYFANRPTGHK